MMIEALVPLVVPQKFFYSLQGEIAVAKSQNYFVRSTNRAQLFERFNRLFMGIE